MLTFGIPGDPTTAIVLRVLVVNGLQPGPMLLGFILGPDMELYFRRGISLEDGNPIVFLTSPCSVVFPGLIVVFFYFLEIRKPKAAALGTPGGMTEKK